MHSAPLLFFLIFATSIHTAFVNETSFSITAPYTNISNYDQGYPVSNWSCQNCVSNVKRFNAFLEILSSPSKRNSQITQVIGTESPSATPTSVIASDIVSVLGVAAPSSACTSKSSCLSTSSDMSMSTVSDFISITSTERITRTISSSNPSSSTSSSETLRIHHTLRSALTVYTITFTLFLLQNPKWDPFEFVLISTTCITGWILLYFDILTQFIRNPQGTIFHLTKSLKLGLLEYGIDRWYTFQLIRRRQNDCMTSHALFQDSPVSFISFNPRFRLNSWWKTDILNNLRSHNLKDYFDTTGYKFQKHAEKSPPLSPLKNWSTRHHEDDIFSSDEDLDTSPLFARLRPVKIPVIPRRGAAIPDIPETETEGLTFAEQGVSAESKETCVDETLSPRAKVSGFIAWEALKRESAVARDAGATDKGDTEASGGSWEGEALAVSV